MTFCSKDYELVPGVVPQPGWTLLPIQIWGTCPYLLIRISREQDKEHILKSKEKYTVHINNEPNQKQPINQPNKYKARQPQPQTCQVL